LVVIVLLLILAFLAMASGFIFLSQATLGVGVIAAGCFLAIVARIAQAAKHQEELKRLLEAQALLASAPRYPASSPG
jgi:hypothetical protein